MSLVCALTQPSVPSSWMRNSNLFYLQKLDCYVLVSLRATAPDCKPSGSINDADIGFLQDRHASISKYVSYYF